MAVIGTIRNRMGYVLVAFVGFALVLFIGEGLMSSGVSLFGTGTTVAKVDGQSISIQEFEKKVEANSESYKARMGVETLNQDMMDNLRDQTWDQMINEIIFGKEYESLGILVSGEELYDMVQGSNIDPQIIQAFTDPNTGRFDRANVVRFLKNLENVDEKQRTQWLAFEQSMRQTRIAQKYQTLLAQSFYVTSAEAKQAINEQLKVCDYRYVLYSYANVKDNEVTVTEDDVKAYYELHKNEYYQPASSRVVDYVEVKIQPSEADFKAIETEINKLAGEFAVAKNDSAFIAMNADSRAIPGYLKKGQLPPSLDTVAFSQSVGYITQPTLDRDVYRVMKVLGTKMSPDSSKARHILIGVQQNAPKEEIEKAKVRIDSIRNIIKAGAPFEEVAMRFSSDKGSAAKGGDLGWFTEGQMVKEFNDACFNGKKGDVAVVTTQFGVHLIEVTDQSKPIKKVKVAILDRKVEPSSETFQSLYATATSIASAINGGNFDAVLTEKKLSKRTQQVRESDRKFGSFNSSREIVRWAFQAKKDDVSGVKETPDAYIIGKMVEIRDKGALPYNTLSGLLKVNVVRDKKAELLIKKLEGKTLEQAAAMTNTTIAQSQISFGDASVMGGNMEPRLAGALSVTKKGATAKPIKGEAGVYLAQVVNVAETPVNDMMVKIQQKRLIGSLKSRASYGIVEELKEKADIQDYRIKFY